MQKHIYCFWGKFCIPTLYCTLGVLQHLCLIHVFTESDLRHFSSMKPLNVNVIESGAGWDIQLFFFSSDTSCVVLKWHLQHLVSKLNQLYNWPLSCEDSVNLKCTVWNMFEQIVLFGNSLSAVEQCRSWEIIKLHAGFSSQKEKVKWSILRLIVIKDISSLNRTKILFSLSTSPQFTHLFFTEF